MQPNYLVKAVQECQMVDQEVLVVGKLLVEPLEQQVDLMVDSLGLGLSFYLHHSLTHPLPY